MSNPFTFYEFDANVCGDRKVIKLTAKEAYDILKTAESQLPLLLWCPECGKRHYDVGVWAKKVHHTHACQHCGMVWRPAIVATVGVKFLPGFKDEQNR